MAENDILNDPDAFAQGGDLKEAWAAAQEAADRPQRPYGLVLAAAAVLLVVGRSMVGVVAPDVPEPEAIVDASQGSSVPAPAPAPSEPDAPAPDAPVEPAVPAMPAVPEPVPVDTGTAPSPGRVASRASEPPPALPEAVRAEPGLVTVQLEKGMFATSFEVMCPAVSFRERGMFNYTTSARLVKVPSDVDCTMTLIGSGTKKKFSFRGGAGFVCHQRGREVFCNPVAPPPQAPPEEPKVEAPAKPALPSVRVPVVFESDDLRIDRVVGVCGSYRADSVVAGA
ncbi:MAG: hypothetical protein KC656_18315, partial [Myxococcales bacterium]|nr:hypothetical protein [Myxococcales bacterium]